MNSEDGSSRECEFRLQKLEKQNRFFTRSATAVLVLVLGLIVMGQTSSKTVETVEAQKFVVRDATGKVRAALGYDASGPALVLFDNNGKTRVGVSCNPSWTSGFTVTDPAGRVRAGLTCDSAGLPSMTIVDETGNGCATMGFAETKGGSPVLVLTDKNGKVLFVAPR